MFGSFQRKVVHFLGDIGRGGFNFGFGGRVKGDHREHPKILVMLARRLKTGYGSMQGFGQ